MNNYTAAEITAMQERGLKILSTILAILVCLILLIGYFFIFKKDNVTTHRVVQKIRVPYVIHVPIKKGTSGLLLKNKSKILSDVTVIDSLQNKQEEKKDIYTSSNDTVKKQLYYDAIELKEFQYEKKSDSLNIKVFGLVSGKVESLNIESDYLLTQEKKRTQYLVGLGAGINSSLSQGIFKINAGIRSKNDKVYLFSYQKIGNQNFGMVEYITTLF